MSIEVMQMRQALDYWMAMCDQYEKRLKELDNELDDAYRELDRLNAVIAAHEQVN